MLKQRLLSAAIIVPGFLLGLFFMPSWVLVCIMIAVSALMMLEFHRMLNLADIPSFRYVCIGCGTAVILATYLGFIWKPGEDGAVSLARANAWENIAIACTVLILLLRQFPQKHNDKPLATIACNLLCVLYVPFLMNFLLKLAFIGGNADGTTPLTSTTGPYLVLYVVLAAKLTDAGAFFIGIAVGRHKLIPRLSPGKTWEGFAGGIATCVIMSVVYFHLVDKNLLGGMVVTTLHAIVLGIVLSLVGMAGDLAESLLKRASMVKDSGKSVPGVGGALDVVDSVLFVAPVFYLYVRMAA